MINRDLLETGRTDEQNTKKERQKKRDRQTDEGKKARQPRWRPSPALSFMWQHWKVPGWDEDVACVRLFQTVVPALACEHFTWQWQHDGKASRSVFINRYAAHTDQKLGPMPRCQWARVPNPRPSFPLCLRRLTLFCSLPPPPQRLSPLSRLLVLVFSHLPPSTPLSLLLTAVNSSISWVPCPPWRDLEFLLSFKYFLFIYTRAKLCLKKGHIRQHSGKRLNPVVSDVACSPAGAATRTCARSPTPSFSEHMGLLHGLPRVPHSVALKLGPSVQWKSFWWTGCAGTVNWHHVWLRFYTMQQL